MTVDVEVRVYLTIRDHGHVDWQVTRTELDGQVSWEDGSSYAVGSYKPLVDRKLSGSVGRAIQKAVYRAVSAQF